MVVEMAVAVPIVIVMALVVVNLMRFVGACARFDRVSLDAVLTQGVSPEGEQDVASGVASVESALGASMSDLSSCSVEVRAESVGQGATANVFSLAPALTRFTCTLRFSPWPTHLSVGGVDAGVPLELVHERSIVVDRYRSGVVG
jgi:hypothetical protein